MSGLRALGSLGRIEKRNLIEDYCRLAVFLPVHKRMLFQLYYKDGYSTVEIGQLLMKRPQYIRLRLLKIIDELNESVEIRAALMDETRTDTRERLSMAAPQPPTGE